MSMPISAMAAIAAGLICEPVRTPGPGHRSALGVLVEEPEGHLGAAGVVHAEEQHGWVPALGGGFGVDESVEALAGETLGREDQPAGHGGGGGEGQVAVFEQGLDGLLAEDPLELAMEVSGDVAQRASVSGRDEVDAVGHGRLLSGRLWLRLAALLVLLVRFGRGLVVGR